MASFPYNLPHFHIFSFVTINLILLYQIYSAGACLAFGGTLSLIVVGLANTPTLIEIIGHRLL